MRRGVGDLQACFLYDEDNVGLLYVKIIHHTLSRAAVHDMKMNIFNRTPQLFDVRRKQERSEGDGTRQNISRLLNDSHLGVVMIS
jgi:hypothetical protein